MAVYDLDGLVAALLGAVHQADKAAQDQHIDLANRYFEQDGDRLVAKSVTVNLPSLSSPGETEAVEVPLITLVPISSMMIKEVEFEFETFISEVAEDGPQAPGAAVDLPNGPSGKSHLKVGLRGGWDVKRRNMMKVKVKIEAQEPPEGVGRLTDRIVKQLP